jgi:hypothetical protein
VDKQAALQAELASSLAAFDGVMEGTEELQVEVTDEVRRRGVAAVWLTLPRTLDSANACHTHARVLPGRGCC